MRITKDDIVNTGLLVRGNRTASGLVKRDPQSWIFMYVNKYVGRTDVYTYALQPNVVTVFDKQKS